MKQLQILTVLAACTLSGAAFAQGQTGGGHQGHGSHGTTATQAAPTDQHGAGHGMHGATPAAVQGDSAATKAFRDANAQMHRDMDIAYTNDVDVDFVRGMIPHHQGAVAMAKIVLEHSKDPEIRKLAEEVVSAQEREIAQMQAFLKKRGH